MALVNAGDTVVRNNIFVSPSPYASFIQLSQSPGVGLTRPLVDVNITGNTFISNGATESSYNFITAYPWTTGNTVWGDNHQNVHIENNIFKAVTGSQIRAINLTGVDNNLLDTLTINNNIVHIPSAPSGNMYRIGSSYYNLSGWQATTSKDTATLAVEPTFAGTVSAVSHAPGEPNAANNINEANAHKTALRLTATSQRNTGYKNILHSYFDFDTVVRYTNDGLVDVGAFEYYVAPLDTTPPTITSTKSSSSSNKKKSKKKKKISSKITYKQGERVSPYITLLTPKKGSLTTKNFSIKASSSDKSGIQAMFVSINGTKKKRVNNTGSILYTAKKLKNATLSVSSYDTLGNVKVAQITITNGVVTGVRYY